MALALLFENDDVMYLDAVTSYSKSRSSSVSSHPVDASSRITDHVSKQNPVFSMRAIISAADFHNPYTRSPQILSGSEGAVTRAYNQPVNGAVIDAPSDLLSKLPGSIQQFISSPSFSSISVDPFRGYTHEIARDRLYDAWDKSELVTILDYDYDTSTGRSASTRLIENCILERLEDTEEVDTGDSFIANLTFRQVRFVTIKEVDVQISGSRQSTQPAEEVADSAAAKTEQGDQTDRERDERAIESIAGGVAGDIVREVGALITGQSSFVNGGN
ncbi:MAG: hypothetical protein CMF22_10660 [Idiomarinaceae bacterium]|nr:hypothetical protein [Idiomarinaceae bacterium]MBG23902.1 hypothetical protein [Idiomarinaceae bacterium]|tara:strand:+ start:1507 stop:2328 length:822 start_codon:yes stop_codon:yes gene_type:complete